MTRAPAGHHGRIGSALLGMTARKFRAAVARQRLPYVTLGQRTVSLVADIEQLAHAKATEAPDLG